MNKKECNSTGETESRILLAAEKEFMEKGYSGARTTTIAEEAGVTHAMLHYYFRTKENLFERIVKDKAEKLHEILMPSEDEMNLSLEETIRIIISRHLDFISENPDLPRFLIMNINSDRIMFFAEEIKTFAPVIIQNLKIKIDKEAKEGKCRIVSPLSLLINILSLNIFPYLIRPIVNTLNSDASKNPVEYLEHRKKENLKIIMAWLRTC